MSRDEFAGYLSMSRFSRFKTADFKVIILFALIFSVLSWLLPLLKNLMLAYTIIAVLIGFFITLTALSIGKFGSIMLFMAISSAFSIGTNTMGVSGVNKIISFIIVGAIFEVFFFLLKFNRTSAGAIVSSSVSCAALPFTVGLILSYDLVKELISSMLNLSLITLLSGLVGSLVAILVWGKIQNKKFFVKMRYAP